MSEIHCILYGCICCIYLLCVQLPQNHDCKILQKMLKFSVPKIDNNIYINSQYNVFLVVLSINNKKLYALVNLVYQIDDIHGRDG